MFVSELYTSSLQSLSEVVVISTPVSIETRGCQEGDLCTGPKAFQCHQHRYDSAAPSKDHQDGHLENGHGHH